MEGSNRGFRIPEIRKRKTITAVLIAAGMLLLLYPWISNYLYENRAQSEIYAYEEELESIDTEENEAILLEAQEYNLRFYREQSGGSRLTDPFSEAARYDEWEASPLSGISASGVIGYIDIPAISVYLPVFEGTDAETLLAGIGLLEGSSLPVGGENTHAVLTGHTGLSSAKMFTDLTELELGDSFYFHVLGETLAYVVKEITVVEPDDTRLLWIREGRDLMTLVTCTPYGVNSHRLYVTGERIEYTEASYESAKTESKTTESAWMAEYRKAVILGLVTVLAVSFVLKLAYRVMTKVLPDGTLRKEM